MKEKEIINIAEELLGKKNLHFEHQILGGMMNVSYVLSDVEDQYIIYFPSDSGKEMVVRPLEKDNYKIAYELGVAPRNYYFDEKTGIKINRFVLGAPLDKISLNHDDYVAVANLLKKIHNSKILSRSDYPVFSSLINYEETLFSFSPTIDQNYLTLKTFLFDEKDYLAKQKKCLCHNDAQRSNIIKGIDGKYYLIDYEFAMNNDPIYDIAAFANSGLNDGLNVLKEYYSTPTFDQYKRFYLWRIYLSLQWYIVALIKHHKDGDKLGYDFISVSKHFLDLALEAKKELDKLVEQQ